MASLLHHWYLLINNKGDKKTLPVRQSISRRQKEDII